MDTRYVPPHKKGRYHHYNRRQPASVLPSKFLLGGNINDPLNLNSLGQSDNANTPKTSPMPVPTQRVGEVPIFIPKNPTDPLGLQNSPFSPATQTPTVEAPRPVVANNTTKSRRHRRRSLRIRNDSECSGGTGEEVDKPDKGHAQETETGKASTCDQDKKPDGSRSSDGLPPTESRKEPIIEAAPGNETVEGAKAVDKDAGQRPAAEDLASKEEGVSSQKCSPAGGSDKVESPAFMGLRRPTSDYVPLSSAHQPSPFILRGDGDDSYEMITFPFESPSLSRFFNSQHMMSEPFSPPTTDMHLNSRRFPAGHYDYLVQQSLRLQPHPPGLPGTSSMRKPKYFTEFQRRPYFRKRIRHNRFDPIVSPVIPQPGMKRTRHHHHHSSQQNPAQNQNASSKADATAEVVDKPEGGKEQQPQSSASGDPKKSGTAQQVHKSFHPKNKTFQYGNYNRYYGYRNSNTLSNGDDVRLRMLKKEWLEGKDVLDIGCNVGHVTLSVARDFKPRRILGVDIDNHLVTAARKNVRHYIDQDPSDATVQFPQYLPLVYGALQPCPQAQPNDDQEKEETKCVPFPYNVVFLQENYVLDDDSQLESVKPEYDAILCLSVTKWIHLNFGDEGLKRFFKRGFRHLRPGGRFILEPQKWSSYQKKKKLTEEIFSTFKQIQFFPDQFQEFLLKEVGYEHVETVGTPAHQAKGFQRPLLVFTKPNSSQEESS